MVPRSVKLSSLAITVAFAALPARAVSAEIPRIDREAIAQEAARGGERYWSQIAERDPYPTMGIRKVFAYALALCEARRNPERLDRLFELAAQDQDRDPESAGYGNFKWTWRDARVSDRNAVEFCMQDAVPIWRRHREWLPESAREKLRELLDYSVEGCLRHRVPTSYTNIAILNSGNLIALGETLDRPDAAAEGYRRLDAFYLWTWRFGTREYSSPTYYGVDLDGLLFIEAHAERESAKRQARALLELFWTDLALSWFLPKQCLAGSQSRSYDYLRGPGHIDRYLWLHGWLPGERPGAAGLLRPLSAGWAPPDRLQRLSRQSPRLVRQSWGPGLAESRTLMLWPDAALGCSGAAYGLQDLPLVVDLPGDRRAVRCYFIADGREDPYGKKKYETGGDARHMKALHLKPFWAAAQRTSDAVGLVVYRPKDIQGDHVFNLQSHLVLRRDVDGFRLRGQALKIPKGTGEAPGRVPLEPGDPLVLRAGTAAVGIRLLWARGQDGLAAPAALVDDGNAHGALRLTVEHRCEEATALAGAAFWIRVGSGLEDDEAWRAWCHEFESAPPGEVEATGDRLRLEVPGRDGPVAVEAAAPFGLDDVTLLPEPTRAVLELDGQEIGRALLEALEPVAAFRRRAESLEPIDVPAEGGVCWEAEAGLLFPRMLLGDDPEASGERFVWQAPDPFWTRSTGTATWPLRVARPGKYWLWGRVFAPDPQTDSFYVGVLSENDEPLAQAGSWHTGHGKRWRWQPVAFDRAADPTPLDLPAGLIQLEIRVREPGTKLDRLFLTADAQSEPE